jgi:hypothetical protein
MRWGPEKKLKIQIQIIISINFTHCEGDVELRKDIFSQVQWLKPVTLATWEEEIWRITVPCQQKVCKTPSQPMAGWGCTFLSSCYTGKHK